MLGFKIKANVSHFSVSKVPYLSLTFERTGDTVSDNIKDKVLELKNKGLSYKAISEQLGIPVSTAKTYLRREKALEGNTCKHCGAELINVKGKKQKSSAMINVEWLGGINTKIL